LLHFAVIHAAGEIGCQWRELAQRLHHTLAFLGVAGVNRGHRVDLLAPVLWREILAFGNGREFEQRADAVALVGEKVAPESNRFGAAVERVDRRAKHDLGTQRIQLELELGDHAEVAAAAAYRPEQIGILLLAGTAYLAIRRHDLDRKHVVDTEPVPAAQPADAARQRQARVAPPATRAVRFSASTDTPRMPLRSIMTPSSQTAWPATL
jgi:hypothetical protein